MNERTRLVSVIAVACAIGIWLVSIVREPALTQSPSGSVDGLVLGTLVMACASRVATSVAWRSSAGDVENPLSAPSPG